MSEEVIEIKDPKAVLEALHRANEDAKKYREERDTYKKRLDNQEWKKRAISAEVRAHVSGLGIKDADRVVKYIGTDGIDFDDDGELTGISEKIESLKSDLPEVFDAKRRVGGKADASIGSSPNGGQSASEKQAAALLGR